VVLGLILMNFVDRDGSVNNRWLDRLLLYNRLDIFVDVVVHMLACDRGGDRRAVLCLADCVGILELGLLSSKAFFNVGVVAVLEVAMFDIGHLVSVLFWEYLAVLDGLDGSVMVVLMNFSIDGRGGLLVSSGLDSLVLHSGVDFFVDGSFMLSILGEEVSNCCLCFFHFDRCVMMWS